METRGLINGASARPAYKEGKFYQMANLIQGVLALGVIATACVLIGLGWKSEDDGKGGLNFIIAFVTNLEVNRTLFMYWFLGGAGLFWGTIFAFEVIVDMECSLKWIFGSKTSTRTIAIIAMRNRALIRSFATCVSWWAVNWSLNMSAGETDGKVLIYEALVFSAAIGAMIAAQFIGHSIKSKKTGSEEDVSYTHKSFAIITLATAAALMLFTTMFFRHLNYKENNKGTGSNLEKNDTLLSAQWLFTSSVIVFFFNELSDCMFKAWEHSGSIARFFMLLMFWPLLLFGKVLSMVKEHNRDMTESLISLVLNLTILVAVPTMLFTEVIDEIATST